MALAPEEAKAPQAVEQPAAPVAPAGPPATPPEPAPAEELDSFQRLFEDLSEAQGKAKKAGKSAAALSTHLQTVLYPLLVRAVGTQVDMRDMLKEIAATVSSDSDEYLAGENIEFIVGFVDDILFPFVHKYAEWAKQEAAAGRTDFQQELGALFRGGSALKKIVQDLGDDEVLVEEVDEDE